MAIAIGGLQEIAGEVRTHRGQVVPVPEGMAVLARDGVSIGRLKAVRDDDMLVDRLLRRDVYVPFEAIYTVEPRGIVLTIEADQVEAMHWPHPPLL